MKKENQVSQANSPVEANENPGREAIYLPKEISQAEEISSSMLRIDTAIGFLGAPYKYGGNTNNGMDCSGLIQTAFLDDQIHLPRTSRDMAQRGIEITVEEVSSGDLLFFSTSSRHSNINHVGLVTEANKEHIFFIHSTTSKGVIISSLEESFWKNSLVMARRVD